MLLSASGANELIKKPHMVEISFDFMQNCLGYTDDVIPTLSYSFNLFVVTIQICSKLVSFLTAKSASLPENRSSGDSDLVRHKPGCTPTEAG